MVVIVMIMLILFGDNNNNNISYGEDVDNADDNNKPFAGPCHMTLSK